MYRSIFVPLDGSAFGEQALALALSVARRAGADLEIGLVHVPLLPVYAEPRPGFDNTVDPRIRESERDYLDKVVQQVNTISTVPVTAVLLEGTVADALSAHISARESGLVVMATHGRGRLSRFWLGSVADQMLRTCPVPLLFLHPRAEMAAIPRDETLRHILIALDGSALAEQILEPAITLGRMMDADYTLLRVVEPLQVVGDPAGYSSNLLEERYWRRLQDEAQIYLDRVAGRLRGQSLRVNTRVIGSRNPAATIL